MNTELHGSQASREYAVAHQAHHGDRKLGEALELYVAITAAHADSPEAGFSRSQIQNIVKAAIPEQELFDAQVKLAREHLGQAT